MSAPSSPVILLIQPDTVARHQIKVALAAGHHAQVVAVEGPEDALHHLADGISGLAAVLLPMPMPADGTRQFLDGLNILAPKPRPAVFVYTTAPTADDLADISEAGATGIIDAPPTLQGLVRELVALRQSGTSPGRVRMQSGATVRAPQATDGRPRVSRDAGWRDRMIKLAVSTRSRTADFQRKRLLALLGKMDELAGGRLSLAYVEAMLLMVRNDARQAEALIKAEQLDRDLIDNLLKLTEERFQFPGGQPAPRAVVMHGLEELHEIARSRRRGDGWTPNYSDLRAGASDLVVGKLSMNSTAGKGYRERLVAWLGVDHDFIDAIDGDRLRRIAARVIKEPDEQDALDYARLSLLAFMLKQRRIWLHGEDLRKSHVDALDALLNGADRMPGEAARLQARAGALSGVSEEDLPLFAEFSSLFAVIEGSDLASGFDTETLDRIRTSVTAVAHAAKATPSPPGASLAGPTTGAAPPTASAASPPAAGVVGTAFPPGAGLARATETTARLLPRLAVDLGLPDTFFQGHDEAALLAGLDRTPLQDVQVAPALLARLRLLAVLLGRETEGRGRLLVTAVGGKYAEAPEALDALLQIVGRAAGGSVLTDLRRAAGLPAARARLEQIRMLIDTGEPRLVHLSTLDLPDSAPEVIPTLHRALSVLRTQAEYNPIAAPKLAPSITALERRIGRLTAPVLNMDAAARS